MQAGVEPRWKPVRLARTGFLLDELSWEALKKHRFKNAEPPTPGWVYVDFAVAVGYRRTRFVPLKTAEAAAARSG